MTIIVHAYQGGIIVVEATPQTALALGSLLREGIETGAVAAGNGADAQAYWETINAAFNGNGMEATKVIGATAFGAVTTIAIVNTGVGAAAIGAAALAAGVILSPAVLATAAVVAGVAAGYYAGEYYSWEKSMGSDSIDLSIWQTKLRTSNNTH